MDDASPRAETSGGMVGLAAHVASDARVACLSHEFADAQERRGRAGACRERGP